MAKGGRGFREYGYTPAHPRCKPDFLAERREADVTRRFRQRAAVLMHDPSRERTLAWLRQGVPTC